MRKKIHIAPEKYNSYRVKIRTEKIIIIIALLSLTCVFLIAVKIFPSRDFIDKTLYAIFLVFVIKWIANAAKKGMLLRRSQNTISAVEGQIVGSLDGGKYTPPSCRIIVECRYDFDFDNMMFLSSDKFDESDEDKEMRFNITKEMQLEISLDDSVIIIFNRGTNLAYEINHNRFEEKNNISITNQPKIVSGKKKNRFPKEYIDFEKNYNKKYGEILIYGELVNIRSYGESNTNNILWDLSLKITEKCVMNSGEEYDVSKCKCIGQAPRENDGRYEIYEVEKIYKFISYKDCINQFQIGDKVGIVTNVHKGRIYNIKNFGQN